MRSTLHIDRTLKREAVLLSWSKGIFALTLIQITGRLEIGLNIILRPSLFTIFSSWSSSMNSFDSPSLLEKGSQIHSSWLCSSWMIEGLGILKFSHKIPANMWNMSRIPMVTSHPYNFSLALKAVTLPADLKTVIILPEVKDLSFFWAGWICHK